MSSLLGLHLRAELLGHVTLCNRVNCQLLSKVAAPRTAPRRRRRLRPPHGRPQLSCGFCHPGVWAAWRCDVIGLPQWLTVWLMCFGRR